jgi:hypothetical protein
MADLLFARAPSRFNAVPFIQALSAAGGRGVLGDKDRMSLHGRLFSVA